MNQTSRCKQCGRVVVRILRPSINVDRWVHAVGEPMHPAYPTRSESE